jgi:CRISPR-associated protein Csb2
MLALGIRYLNGFAVAANPYDRARVEWPPHPGRVFMALAAAYFQANGSDCERVALEWLERQDAPLMHVPDVQTSRAVTQFVPVNPRLADERKARNKEREEGKKPPPPLQSAPGIIRSRQPRTFARGQLEDDTVWLMWPEVEPSIEIREALAALSAKVTRIGHSSSLVQMWIDDSSRLRMPNWVPNEDISVMRLRIPVPGTLEDLEKCFSASSNELYADLLIAAEDDSDKTVQKAARDRLRKECGNHPPARQRPHLSASQGYAAPPGVAEASTRVQGTVLGPHFITLRLERMDGPYQHLDLLDTLSVCERLHKALCSKCEDLDLRVASVISGRAPDGTPLAEPHLALIPLAFVGHPHTDGRLLGVGLALPQTLSREYRRGVLTALERVQKEGLKLGRLGSWGIVPLAAQRPPLTLLPETWTAYPDGNTHWATVTPIAFDQHPKAKDRAEYQIEIAAMIVLACQRVGLPEPRQVVATPVSAHLGSPPAHTFPRLPRKDGSQRRHSHAILIFAEPVRGPILLGAGRYRGYGLCLPMTAEGHA